MVEHDDLPNIKVLLFLQFVY